MSVKRNEFDSSKLEVAISVNPGARNATVVTSQLAGGSLSGLFDVRDNVILPTIREIGKLAIGIADTFNRQQSLGRDLNGDAGSMMFTDVNDPQTALTRTLNSSENPTKTNFEIYIRNTEKLSADEYDMSYDGTNLEIYDADKNLIQQFTPADIAAMSAGTEFIIGDTGLSMAIDFNGLTAGDTFKIRATYFGANQIERTLEDPRLIAAADNPLSVAEVNNPNNVELSLYEITNSSSPAPLPLPDDNITIRIDATGTNYEILDSTGASISGPLAIPADQIIDDPVAGFRFEIKGVMAGGEEFTVTHADNPGVDESKKFGPGDNTNIMVMLGFQTERLMDNGDTSFSESYADLVTRIGVETKSREISMSSFETLLSGAEEWLAGI
jgi:flagellar hook-associated protein 1 FlgK